MERNLALESARVTEATVDAITKALNQCNYSAK